MVEFFGKTGASIPFTFFVLAIGLAILYIILIILERKILARFNTKKHQHTIKVTFRVVNYLTLFIVSVMFIMVYIGGWSGLGVWLGLFTAALGFALQKPISGIAAWLMVIVQRPFRIGDRVAIGTVRGDVAEIRLSHIYISEIGGIVPGEEKSNRIILVPNNLLFDLNIINYTKSSDYMLDEVRFTITFGSNIDKAKKIALEACRNKAKEIIDITKSEPYIRTFFTPHGMQINLRYISEATRLQEFSSSITEEIVRKIKMVKDVEIAYPHTKVVMDKQL